MTDHKEMFFFGFGVGVCAGIAICKLIVVFGIGTL